MGTNDARALLDQLMGQERDVELSKRTNRVRMFYDDEVCKHHVAGLSPYHLFKNTKWDLGEYEKILDDECQNQYIKLTQEQRDSYGYENELLSVLARMVSDNDQKVARGKDRIKREETSSDISGSATEKEQEKQVFIAKIEELNSQAEKAGDDGDVEKAMEFMEKAKALKADVDKMDAEERSQRSNPLAERKLIICEVCANFMSSKDGEERLQDHYAGKQHKGWASIREKYNELVKLNPKRGVPGYRHDSTEVAEKAGGESGGEHKAGNGSHERRERHRSRSRDRSRRRRSRSRDRDRDRDRDHTRRKRDRSPRRERSRSRDRDRHRRH